MDLGAAPKVRQEMVVQEKVREVSDLYVWSKPLTFDEFLDTFGPKDFVELVDGVVVEKTMVQLDHERLQRWLYVLLSLYAERSGKGEVLGSRSAVKISEFRGRLPDLFFVRRENQTIVQQKATFGPPDLTLEIVSPSDKPSGMIALEVDYTAIGVAEIVFIDQRKQRVRVLRKREKDYEEQILTEGTLRLETLGVSLELAWLFDEPRPDELELLQDWLKTA
jgi:Uma2 family endonuclease